MHTVNTSRDIEQWLAHLYQLDPTKIKLGLDRVQRVLQRHPIHQFNIPVVTVTGTNGKGSTVTLLSELLRQNGFRVGSFTSPHVFQFNERIQLNNQLIDNKRLIQAFETINRVRGEIELTFFEFITLAALDIFQTENLDYVVLEVGLGGRKDVVNCVDADISVMTSIGLDHCEYLGDTRELVAADKFGIARPGKPMVCGDPNPPENLEILAREEGVPLLISGHDFHFHQTDQSWSFKNAHFDYKQLSLPNIPMQNAATVLEVISLILPNLPKDSVQQAMEVRLPGRMMPFPNGQSGYLDMAHNPHAAGLLAAQLQREPCLGKTYALFSCLADKDVDGIVEQMSNVIDEWHVAKLDSVRAMDVSNIAASIKRCGAKVVQTYPDIAAAYREVSRTMQSVDRIIAFGSAQVVEKVGTAAQI